jgi:hypothetical protein
MWVNARRELAKTVNRNVTPVLKGFYLRIERHSNYGDD